MELAEVAFWLCAGLVVYPYVVYPAVLALLARLVGRPIRPTGPLPRSVSIVVAARDEAANIDRRLGELTALLESSGLDGELILVSDGSSDDTAARASQLASCLPAGRWLRVVELSEKVGKAVALTRGVEAATGEVVVFADMRQTWAPDALTRLLTNFADPCVGAVSGDLVVSTGPGTLAGVGLYWRFEKWLRRQESLLGAQVGVTGAVSAVRRDLFRAIPAGTILDDVYWPLRVALQGHRVIHDQSAVAYDRLPDRTRDEFRRKVRTLAGNFQLAARLPVALVPGLSPVWWQFWSHKLLRLAVPWALLALLTLPLVLPAWPYRPLLALQLGFYTLSLVGLLTARGGRISSSASSFLVLNAAAWVAFWVWATGQASRSWHRAAYRAPPESPGLPGRAVRVGLPALGTCFHDLFPKQEPTTESQRTQRKESRPREDGE